jgi:hypothetical protein
MCVCNGVPTEAQAAQQQYTVSLPDGTKKVVQGEANAKIEVTMAGPGSSYTKN